MALEFLRQNSVNDILYETDSKIGQKKSAKKFSGKKFTILLSGNLVVWLIFAVSFFNLRGFSMPPLPTFSKPQKLALTGIIYNEKSPAAIISNEVYREGDQVDGYTILSIARERVKFQKGGEFIVRELHGNGHD